MRVARLFRAHCARHVDMHVRGHLAKNVVRLLVFVFLPSALRGDEVVEGQFARAT